LVKCAGGQFLAGARRTDDEHPAVGWGHPFDGLAQLSDRGRASDQRRWQGGHLFELLDLALEPRRLERTVRHQHQPVSLEWFLDEIIGAMFDGGDRGLDIAVPRNHHHRQIVMLLFDGVEQLQAIEFAALQPNVEKNQVWPACENCGEGIVAVACRACAIAFVL
jgi:hypothetical protein